MKGIISIAMLVVFSCLCLSGCGKSKEEKDPLGAGSWEKDVEKLERSSPKPTKPMWK